MGYMAIIVVSAAGIFATLVAAPPQSWTADMKVTLYAALGVAPHSPQASSGPASAKGTSAAILDAARSTR